MMATKTARPQRSHIRPSYRQTGDDPEWRILGAVLKRAIFDARSRHVRTADREEALTVLIEEGSEWLQYIEVQRDGKRPQFFAIPLWSLTTWLTWWWGVDRVLQRWAEGMARRLVGTWFSLSVALIILAIGWTAVRYGLGLKV